MKAAGFIVIGVLAVGMIAGSLVIQYGTKDDVSFVVEHRERIVERNSDGQATSRYLIFTESETFENVDSFLNWKFNSSDLYGRMQPGRQCDATVTGFRVPFLSMYRNVVDVRCVNGPSDE